MLRELLTLHAELFFMVLLSVDFFRINFFKKSFRNVSNGLDPGQDLPVGPDLSPKLFAKVISRRQKWLLARKELNHRSKPINAPENGKKTTKTIVLLSPDLSSLVNSVDPDQLDSVF